MDWYVTMDWLSGWYPLRLTLDWLVTHIHRLNTSIDWWYSYYMYSMENRVTHAWTKMTKTVWVNIDSCWIPVFTFVGILFFGIQMCYFWPIWSNVDNRGLTLPDPALKDSKAAVTSYRRSAEARSTAIYMGHLICLVENCSQPVREHNCDFTQTTLWH